MLKILIHFLQVYFKVFSPTPNERQGTSCHFSWSRGPVAAYKVNSAFHPSKVDQMSTRNLWELRDKK